MKRSATNFMKLGLIFVAVFSNAIIIWGCITREPAGIIAGIAGLSAVWLWFKMLENEEKGNG